ncbi:lysine N(6)-hydroxylase/L-ornithine N(5)-oxygenase family protein [Vibrio nomapromontoriensis]|uniref:lysine N(6)-hydroxylase/L-ornithine N(5)-oxygenase family protein n=1 Tax=Vibrio nomapromontoriensis TaxID=2910246 RepID=UPI003D0B23E5
MKHTTVHQEIYDLIGVGAGPFNLSVAALVNETSTVKSLFLEARSQFSWHPGLLLDNAHMQTHFLKDLVSAVCPTSPYSFLNYLVTKKKYYRFLSTEQNCISRQEFSDYLHWASNEMPNVQFNHPVEQIEKRDGLYHVHSNGQIFKARHLCLGTGKTPFFPESAKPFLGANVFHAAEIALRDRDFSGRKVTIVGGGQSGADIFLNILNEKWGKPARLNWISRRANYQPLDEASFTNEYFTPDYVENFYKLNHAIKEKEVASQKLTSDGVTQKCLLEIYQALYQRFDVAGEERWVHLLPHRTMVEMNQVGDAFRLHYQNGLTSGAEQEDTDIVILATGYQGSVPSCAKPLETYFQRDHNQNICLGQGFNIAQFDQQNYGEVFVVNAGIHSHGIAEPQLSLAAWRAAKIINSVANSMIFDISSRGDFIDWNTPSNTSLSMNHDENHQFA